jgi:hypothetical protein
MDEHCAAIEDELLSSINDNTAVYNVYAVCVTENKNSVFEILSIKNLLAEENRFNTNFGIVAFVRGKKSAVATVENIFKDWLKKNNSLDGIKDYYYKNCD